MEKFSKVVGVEAPPTKKKVKKVHGAKMNEKDAGLQLLQCVFCKEFREKEFFNRNKVNGVMYYRKNKCRVCLKAEGKVKDEKRNSKILIEDTFNLEPINDRLENLIADIEMKRGYADIIDCYKVIDVYVDIFGVEYTELKTEDEVMYMYTKLKHYYKRNVVKDETAVDPFWMQFIKKRRSNL